ncbi:hypothetical protein TVAG_195710 [Trichomonas vaginalis G3]|uniref:Brl1/Brr6 domain-containing protein n=1 Tax=Trichomonas vaginalis (strain ATCC PRA-98 / G3) TaxID=412133 RepID=A2ETL0_TRIV3|nr:nucleus export protein BRR6 family [Trichomonas vaginalis G3]EAY03978.1 hypothetical protein TVAG_195710 [Trichomonas vaginalis G3]KAI5534892.1 nucleus export protein BRR6 family [Trichomonas vaginalis G3]|eukprot:XP_001316201.1 hypothetical protein [Trichomonas vaginalis G3]
MTIVQRKNDNENRIVVAQNINDVISENQKIVQAATTHIIVNIIIKIIFTIIGLFLFFITFRSISLDIKKREKDFYEMKKIEIEKCKKDYEDNLCDQNINEPRYQEACMNFKKCKDSKIEIEKSEITFNYLGQAINDFFEALSFATIAKILFCFLAGYFLINFIFYK